MVRVLPERNIFLKEEEFSQKESRILDAALALFNKQGFHGTPVPLVATKANVGTGTIYRYFDSKEDLVNVLYRRYKSMLLEQLDGNLAAEAQAEDQFEAIWSTLVGFQRENPEAFVFLELHYHSPYLDEKSIKLNHNLRDFMKGFIQNIDEKEMDDRIEALVSLIFGSFSGLVRSAMQNRVEINNASLQVLKNSLWTALLAAQKPTSNV